MNLSIQGWLIIGASISIIWGWLLKWVDTPAVERRIGRLRTWQLIALFYVGFVLFLGLIVLFDNAFIRQ